MQEKIIQPITPNRNLEKVDRAFVSKDFLTYTDIDEMAKNVADSIKKQVKNLDEEQEVEAIVQVLQAKKILDYFSNFIRHGKFKFERVHYVDGTVTLSWKDKKGVKQSDILSPEELDGFLEKIRLAILDRLPGMLPPRIITRITKEVLERKSLLQDGAYYKERTSYDSPGIEDFENKNYIEALKYLDTLPEKSPFIYYGTEIIDPKSGRTINKAVDLDTIGEILSMPRRERPDFTKVLNYFIDCIDGHLFLLSHRLILSDNHLNNLGINKNTDKGILFDLKGLRIEGTETTYRANFRYAPRERDYDGETLRPAGEAEIVHELGMGLMEIITNYLDEIYKFRWVPKIEKLYKSMIDTKLNKRPALAKVKQELEMIRSKLS